TYDTPCTAPTPPRAQHFLPDASFALLDSPDFFPPPRCLFNTTERNFPPWRTSRSHRKTARTGPRHPPLPFRPRSFGSAPFFLLLHPLSTVSLNGSSTTPNGPRPPPSPSSPRTAPLPRRPSYAFVAPSTSAATASCDWPWPPRSDRSEGLAPPP